MRLKVVICMLGVCAAIMLIFDVVDRVLDRSAIGNGARIALTLIWSLCFWVTVVLVLDILNSSLTRVINLRRSK